MAFSNSDKKRAWRRLDKNEASRVRLVELTMPEEMCGNPSGVSIPRHALDPHYAHAVKYRLVGLGFCRLLLPPAKEWPNHGCSPEQHLYCPLYILGSTTAMTPWNVDPYASTTPRSPTMLQTVINAVVWRD